MSNGTRFVQPESKDCAYRYEGTTSQQEVLSNIKELMADQVASLSPSDANGIAQEFRQAIEIVQGLSPGRYRKVVLRCEEQQDSGEDEEGERFMILDKDCLFDLRLRSDSTVGVETNVFQRVK